MFAKPCTQCARLCKKRGTLRTTPPNKQTPRLQRSVTRYEQGEKGKTAEGESCTRAALRVLILHPYSGGAERRSLAAKMCIAGPSSPDRWAGSLVLRLIFYFRTHGPWASHRYSPLTALSLYSLLSALPPCSVSSLLPSRCTCPHPASLPPLQRAVVPGAVRWYLECSSKW